MEQQEYLRLAEACLTRGTALELYLPFDESTFLANSVDFAGADWRNRFFAARSKATLHIAPDELGPLRTNEDPYERVNLWMLERAALPGPSIRALGRVALLSGPSLRGGRRRTFAARVAVPTLAGRSVLPPPALGLARRRSPWPGLSLSPCPRWMVLARCAFRAIARSAVLPLLPFLPAPGRKNAGTD